MFTYGVQVQECLPADLAAVKEEAELHLLLLLQDVLGGGAHNGIHGNGWKRT